MAQPKPMQCAFGLHRVAQRHALNPCHVQKKRLHGFNNFWNWRKTTEMPFYLMTKRINDGLVKTFKINQFNMIWQQVCVTWFTEHAAPGWPNEAASPSCAHRTCQALTLSWNTAGLRTLNGLGLSIFNQQKEDKAISDRDTRCDASRGAQKATTLAGSKCCIVLAYCRVKAILLYIVAGRP